MSISCPFCDRTSFTSQRALTQHQQRNNKCYDRLCDSLGAESGYTTAPEFFSCAKANAGRNNPDLADLAAKTFHPSSRLGAMQVHYDVLKQKVLLNLGGYQTAREVESDKKIVQRAPNSVQHDLWNQQCVPDCAAKHQS